MSSYKYSKYINDDIVKLVYNIAFSYNKNFLDFDDLIQEGFLGLYKAYNSYNSSKNVSFKTYAYYWIKKQISEYVKKNRKIKIFEEFELEDLSYEEKFDFDEKNIDFKTDELDFLEQKVLDLFYNHKKTFNEISEILNLKREKIRQIYSKALRKIKINKKLTQSLLKVNL